MSAKHFYADQFRKNDDVFRSTMESIFKKYSNLNDPGIDVCLKTMTCMSEKGSVPIDSAEGERELETLKIQVNTNHSIREFEDQENEEMDWSEITEDNLTYSDQKENIESLWHGGDSFQHSMNGINSSHDSLWGVTDQPEEEDEELEKTLSSHGSTLLDVYPSMVNQIGEAYRRQRVTDRARAVLQKYRRKQWHSGVSNPRSTSLRNMTLNKRSPLESSFTKQSPGQQNISNCTKGSSKFENLLNDKLKPSPLKNASYEASACFYSPRRNIANVSGISHESPWTELHFEKTVKQSPARVIDLSTPPHSVSPSLSDQSPDLNQTYDVGPTVLSTSCAVPASLVSTCPQPVWQSPGRTAKSLSLVEKRKRSITPQPCDQLSSNVSLNRDCFRDRLHFPVSSPLRGLSYLSPSKRSNFTSMSTLNFERQQSKSTAIHSPVQKSPLRCQAHSESQRSPYGKKEVVMSSPRHSLYHQSFSTAEKLDSPRMSKNQHSHSASKSAYLVKHDSYGRPQIDAEFRKLYHHFICHGMSSPCPSSHCHLCEKTSQNPGFSSSNMSALALTPLRTSLKKRRRQPEVEESLRFKRFRESCSPIKHFQRLQHQLKDGYTTSPLPEASEDKHTWERAILLQCPSPRFLRRTGNLRRIRESKLAMQMNQNASSWRDGVHMVKAESSLRSFNQDMTPLTPSLSRRRLQYGLLQ
ncbi:uncharacterized protein [Paramisgurnus dabryanus]|uniref:uncharacterized protein n=1 Tax=Paramisgurnus dabryanus TaxID=90735 RepID=UPI0031F3FCDB